MTRIGDDSDAQRVREQQRQEEKREGERRADRDFSELVEQRRQGEQRVREQRASPAPTQRPAGANRGFLDQRAAEAKRQAERLVERAAGSAAETRSQAQSRARDRDRGRTGERAGADGEVRGEVDPLAPVTGEGGRGGGGGSGAGDPSGEGSSMAGGQQRDDGPGDAAGVTDAAEAGAGRGAEGLLRVEQIRQLVDRILVAVDDAGDAEVLIELGPEVLGGASLRLRADGREISVTFLCEDTNTRRLVKASEGPLARAFAHRGMSLARLEVAVP